MLIISRKRDQKIILADNIEITILEVGRNRVRFGINAPKEVPIHTRLKATSATEQPAAAADPTEPPVKVRTLPAVVGISARP